MTHLPRLAALKDILEPLETLLGPLIYRTARKAELFHRWKNRHPVANLFASLALFTHRFVLRPDTLDVPAEVGHTPLSIL